MKFYPKLYTIIVFILINSCTENKLLCLDFNDKNLTLENGILMHNSTKFSGSLVSYYENRKTLKLEIHYLDGKKHGLEQKWYSNTTLAEERFYAEGIKIGIHKAWWKNGNQKFTYHFNETGYYDGSVKEWYDNGNLYKNFNYIKGKEVGKQKLWKYNGTISANYEVINGERFGLIGLKKCYKVTVGSDVVSKSN